MMPAANQGVGMNMGMPDVCTTPAAPAPIPIPYPNIGMNAMSMPFVPNVLVSMAPAQNMGAKPMLTNGDNAGVAHPLFMQPGGTTVGNPRILMGGMPASHLGVPTYGNNFNNPVGAKTVPSVTNVLLGSAATLDASQEHATIRQLYREDASLRQMPHGILILDLPCISLASSAWLGRQLARQRGRTVRGIAIDLRGNPGGSVLQCLAIAARLAKTGAPLALVTDSRCASAAEMLVACLRDGCARVRIFGERTFGKGCVQTFALTQRSLHALGGTVEVQGPTGRSFDRVGIHPDVACATTTAVQEATHWLRTQNKQP